VTLYFKKDITILAIQLIAIKYNGQKYNFASCFVWVLT